jgi:hypothetical protein
VIYLVLFSFSCFLVFLAFLLFLFVFVLTYFIVFRFSVAQPQPAANGLMQRPIDWLQGARCVMTAQYRESTRSTHPAHDIISRPLAIIIIIIIISSLRPSHARLLAAHLLLRHISILVPACGLDAAFRHSLIDPQH